jgi:hypothetical protein
MTRTFFTRAGALALLAALLFSMTPAQEARAQIGSSAVVFLMIEPDSRAAGMGNAGAALGDNANAIFWNPAGLAFQRGTEIAVTHSNWLPEFNAGLFYEYLVGKHHVDGLGTFGAHVTYLFLGEHECRDAQNNPCGSFKSYDLATGLSYGFNVTDNLALGTGLRVIYSSLAQVDVGAQETNPGVTAGFDLAALYRSPSFSLGNVDTRYNIGVNLANMGPKIQYSDSEQADPIPTNIRIGQALTFDLDEFNQLTFAVDLNKTLVSQSQNCEDPSDPATCTFESDPFYEAIFSSWSTIDVCPGTRQSCEEGETAYKSLSALEQMTLGAGAEYWYNQLFALRGGYFYENPNFGDRQFLTFGAGLRYNIVGVDFSYIYALEENHPLSNTMRFSLLIDFQK